jgi:hypothetical protein
MDECHVVEAYLINVHFHHHQSSSLGRESMDKRWMDECYVVEEAYLINGHFHHHHPSSLGRKSMDG